MAFCRQHTPKGHPSQLQRLKAGSVLMFGSCLAKLFVLDTVFVVDHWFDFTLDTIATLPLDATRRTWPLPSGERSDRAQYETALIMRWGNGL